MNSIGTTRRSFIQQLTAVASLAGCALGSAAERESHESLRNAMSRAARCCLAWLNAEQEYLPTGGYEVAHDCGRWVDAMLRFEHATGITIPASAEAAILRNITILTDNPAALLLNTARLPGPAAKILVNPHNLRETLLAYSMLVRHRQSGWARQQGQTLLRTMEKVLEADGQMDYARLAELAGGPLTKDPLMVQRSPSGQWFNATATTGRAIEAIVSFYEASGDVQALELAKRLAEVHLRQSIDPSGKIRAELLDSQHVGHTHSYCGTLRGLVAYGRVSGEKKYLEAVRETYRNGLWAGAISHSGWTSHDQGKKRFFDKEGDPIGEHASCGDIAQIALWLGLEANQPELLDDVERLIRARLLPSQIRDPKDARRDGAWGVYSHPFGFGSILDVFAAVLHSLADFHERAVVITSTGAIAVHLHFAIETAMVSVLAERGAEAMLKVTPKEGRELRLRVPGWAPRGSVTLKTEDRWLPLQWEGTYLVVPKDEVIIGRAITLRHALPERESVEVMPVSGRQFHLSWRGDEVVSSEPPVPIYPSTRA